MKFVDYNFVNDETAKRIMESYGYDVSEKEEIVEEITEEELDQVIEEDSTDSETLSEEEGPLCVIEREGDFYALCEEIEAIDELLYIPVIAIPKDDAQNLDESNSMIMESVEYEDETFDLGEVFEDENSGNFYVQLGKYE